jgi:DNA-binding MarR family transcriptional regulator
LCGLINGIYFMREIKANSEAYQLADLTFHLLTYFKEKEISFAEKNGLTQAEFRCLKYFSTNEYMHNKQISKKMKLTAGRLTRIIDSLITKKYMIREIYEKDRRYMRVNLTETGVSVVKQLNKDYAEIHREILSGIDTQYHKQIIKAMDQLVSGLRKWIYRPDY